MDQGEYVKVISDVEVVLVQVGAYHFHNSGYQDSDEITTVVVLKVCL